MPGPISGAINSNHAKIAWPARASGNQLKSLSTGHYGEQENNLDGQAKLADLKLIAEQFAISGIIKSISPLGDGNVNQTFLVVSETQKIHKYVLQQINTRVFPKPELLMHNMARLGAHAEANPLAERWIVPKVIPLLHTDQAWFERDGEFWRIITYVEDAKTLQTIGTTSEALEMGRALGLFHRLVSSIPVVDLADTLPGFHVTPGYLETYRATLEQAINAGLSSRPPELEACLRFVGDRESSIAVLEAAQERGEIEIKPIHGDPKVNNVMICRNSDRAIAMVDLDTVKPGLVHYDIGDCCRSACNRLGEETEDIEAVHFDTQLCEAILDGYISSNQATLKAQDFDYLYDAIRLITFELGLRFLTDHLAGDTYFKVNRPAHNLHRARVQFKLTESIEAQAESIRSIIARLR